MNLSVYTTVDELKRIDLGVTTLGDDQDLDLRQIIWDASRDFELLCLGRWFYPRYESRWYDLQETSDSVRVLKLDDDLAELDTVFTENGNTQLTNATILPSSSGNYNRRPYNKLTIDLFQTSEIFNISTSPLKVTKVSGWWGYLDWTNSWVTLPYSYESAGTDSERGAYFEPTFYATVPFDKYSDHPELKPPFQQMQTIRVQDSVTDAYELMQVTKVETGRVYVTRAINGSSSQINLDGQSVEVFIPEHSVKRAVRRLAAWYYRQKDSASPELDRPIITGSGTVILPSGYPEDVVRVASSYRRHDFL